MRKSRTKSKTAKSSKTAKINDLDMSKWRDYDDLISDSLWIINSRDNSGVHTSSYHGNFIPQIPSQLIRRFTRSGGVVLDAFLGSGTTLIEAQRLNRYGIGVELLPEMAKFSNDLLELERNSDSSLRQQVILGDSKASEIQMKIKVALSNIGKDWVDLILLHPPYDNIVKFSNHPADLSNMPTTIDFIEAFGEVVSNIECFLNKSGHIALVIGDKYIKSEWIPLGFMLMEEVKRRAPNLILKSVVVKNMSGNRGKRNQEQLWRFRSLNGGFYVFKHEYIFLFKRIK